MKTLDQLADSPGRRPPTYPPIDVRVKMNLEFRGLQAEIAMKSLSLGEGLQDERREGPGRRDFHVTPCAIEVSRPVG